VTEIEAEGGGSHVRELDRIAAFTDGVIAIAITLLVLNIQVPHLGEGQGSLLDNKLLHLWRDLLAYGISFAVIGRYWLIHHRFFATLVRYDRRLVTLNLVFLAFLVLIPFVSDVIGLYGDIAAGVIAYAIVLSATAMMNFIIINYGLRRGFVAAGKRGEIESFAGVRGLLVIVVFALSIPVALVSPEASQIMWLAILVLRPRLPALPHGASD
jgi:TMEM175 potassium channel family protein